MKVTVLIKLENVKFTSERHRLLGRVYRPDGRGKHPAVTICHGFPGDAKNMDLAEELAFNGIVTFVFYYQGAWGSSGPYRLTKLESGLRDAIAYLKGLPYVDSERVGLVGHSMGALPLTKRMSLDPTIKTGVLMAPTVDMKAIAEMKVVKDSAKHLASMAEGKLMEATYEILLSDLKEVSMTTNPVDLAPKIKAPIIVIVGSKDVVTPPNKCKIFYDKAKEPKKWIQIDGADHSFSEHRVPLIRGVLEWLKTTL